MEFNWINVFNGVTIVLMLIPNIIFSIKNKEKKPIKANKIAVIIEQISRYGCMLLMIFPVLIWEFGFSPIEFMFVYLIGNIILLILYFVFWVLYFKKKTLKTGVALSIIPGLIFINSAASVKYWILLFVAIVFVFSHTYVTVAEHKSDELS